MTRARRISAGERTAATLVHDPDNPQVIDTSVALTGVATEQPDRICKRCDNAVESGVAYGLVISSTGLGHYTADDGTTLCGLDTAEMTTA